MVKHAQKQKYIQRRGKARREIEKKRKQQSSKRALALEKIGEKAVAGIDPSAIQYEEQFSKNYNLDINEKNNKKKNKSLDQTSKKALLVMNFMKHKDNANPEKLKEILFNETKSSKANSKASSKASLSDNKATNKANNKASLDDTNTNNNNNNTNHNIINVNEITDKKRSEIIEAIKEGREDDVPEIFKKLIKYKTEKKSKLKSRMFNIIKKEKENLKKLSKELKLELNKLNHGQKRKTIKNPTFKELDEFLNEKEIKKNEKLKTQELLSLEKDDLMKEELDYDVDDYLEEKVDFVEYGEQIDQPPELEEVKKKLEKKRKQLKEKEEENEKLEKQRELERQRVVENYNKNKLERIQNKANSSSKASKSGGGNATNNHGISEDILNQWRNLELHRSTNI
ncbi:hypothetical protein ABK040_007967 [Willaertia magna]